MNVDKNVFRLVKINDTQKEFVNNFQISFFREYFCDAIDMSVFVHKIHLIYLIFRCLAIDAHQNIFYFFEILICDKINNCRKLF